MFKLIFTALFLSLTLQANVLFEKIENLIGEQSYKEHKNLIQFVFSQDASKYYLSGEKLNYFNIIKELKQNGLLNLQLAEPKEILVEFYTSTDPVKSLKILNETLKSLGYYYYFTKHTSYDGDGSLKWVIKLKTEFMIDPQLFISELLKKEARIIEIKREENDKWIYKIDTNFANISESIFIDSNEIVKLQKPLRPYFISIKGGKVIKVMSTALNYWYPHIVFYDEHLNILNIVKEDKIFKRISLRIPDQTKYIKINDLYTLVNIKRGLSVIIKE